MSASERRKGYLDWLRGLAVLIMIEAHVFDSWTRVPDRQSVEFAFAMIVGGFGAPFFLFLAGVAVPLSAGAKYRRSGDSPAAAGAVARRGLEIFGLAFLFRVQSWILGWGSPRNLLKVDILNIMGPSISAAALLWRAAGSLRGRLAVFALATVATTLATPLVRSWSPVRWLPDPIEAYISPVASLEQLRVLSMGRVRVRRSDRRACPRRRPDDRAGAPREHHPGVRRCSSWRFSRTRRRFFRARIPRRTSGRRRPRSF